MLGSGIPVYCVIIRSTLLSGKSCSSLGSILIGGVLPFVLALPLYQGNSLVVVLNWTGLIINGIVAFLLPLALSIYVMRKRLVYHKTHSNIHLNLQIEMTNMKNLSNSSQDLEDVPLNSPKKDMNEDNDNHFHQDENDYLLRLEKYQLSESQSRHDETLSLLSFNSNNSKASLEINRYNSHVMPLPNCLKKSDIIIACIIFLILFVMIVMTIIFDLLYGMDS